MYENVRLDHLLSKGALNRCVFVSYTRNVFAQPYFRCLVLRAQSLNADVENYRSGLYLENCMKV